MPGSLLGIAFACRGRKGLLRTVAAVILSVSGLILVSCGGGARVGGGGTPPGTYTLTITGKVGSLSHAEGITLIVQ